MPNENVPLGKIVGKYRVKAKIGCGQLHDFYTVEDVGLGRVISMKVVGGPAGLPRDVIRRFRREARVTAALSHPNIMAIHDAGEQEGFWFQTTERLQPGSLQDRLAAGRLPLGLALRVAHQIQEALTHAHASGVSHGALTPAAVWFDPSDNALLTDFALLEESADAAGDWTALAAIVHAMVCG